MSVSLSEIYDILYGYYGPQKWWPAKTKFEVIAGAILTQNTNWKNVERAIVNIKNEGKTDIRKISEIDINELEELIRPSGFFKQKADRLQRFCRFILDEYETIENMFKEESDKLRNKLLEFNGIGHETADSILLYAGNIPFFVVDAYTKRILKRIGFDINNDYETIRRFFENGIPRKAQIYNEYHALIVQLAKDFCRKKPLCKGCPLEKKCLYSRNNKEKK